MHVLCWQHMHLLTMVEPMYFHFLNIVFCIYAFYRFMHFIICALVYVCFGPCELLVQRTDSKHLLSNQRWKAWADGVTAAISYYEFLFSETSPGISKIIRMVPTQLSVHDHLKFTYSGRGTTSSSQAGLVMHSLRVQS